MSDTDDGPQGGDQRDAAAPGRLAPALYFVATPIGTADDITLRALDVLRRADVLAAEDTRRTRRLLEIHGVPLAGRPLLPYHDHNGPAQRPRLLARLEEGQSVACVSDAGTPLVADPGYRLAVEAIAAGHQVLAAPGASAVLAALTVAGLPTDRFYFGGFLPPRESARRAALAPIAGLQATLVFFESARRVADTLGDMAETLGQGRQAAVCRELTKRFEEVRRASLAELAAQAAEDPVPRGEIVLVVGPPEAAEAADDAAIDRALLMVLDELGVKEAATKVAHDLSVPRRRVYARALALRDR